MPFSLVGALALAAAPESPVQITPLGQTLLSQAEKWEEGQWLERSTYALPQRCAVNVSRIFKDVGLERYSGDSVWSFLGSVRKAVEETHRGYYVTLPRNNPAGIRAAINKIYDGHLPVGTIIAGCTTPSCGLGGPDEHIALVGETDAHGNITAWHNNWLRKDVDRSVLGPYMVSLRNLKAGYPRQWMSTPWLNVKVDEHGLESETTVLPEIDDLDPNQYHVTLVVIPELAEQVEAEK